MGRAHNFYHIAKLTLTSGVLCFLFYAVASLLFYSFYTSFEKKTVFNVPHIFTHK